MENADPKSFHNWLPHKLIEKENQLWLEWIFMSNIPFTKPFFDETISEFKQENSLPPNQISARLTPLEFLIDVAKSINSITPSLFIFHTSRCGSTLATQLLSLSKENIVVAEYPMIDTFLRINEKRELVSNSIRNELIKSIVAVVGQKREEKQQRLIIKLDSWHFIFYNEIRKLFPEANTAILFRDPDSILKSNSLVMGMQFIPDLVSTEFFRLKNALDGRYSPVEYSNKVLESMYRFINEIFSQNKDVILLNYADGMENNMGRILQTLKMVTNFKNQQEFQQRLNYHSKNPNVIFSEEKIICNKQTVNETRKAYLKLTTL